VKQKCEICQHKSYYSKFTYSQCSICGKHIITPHSPPYKLCIECAVEHQRCEQCGCEIAD